jgi:hypothetical protein
LGFSRNLRIKSGVLIATLGCVLTLLYIPFGHGFIRTVYKADLPIARLLMAHKGETPLIYYFNAADVSVLKVSVFLILLGIVLGTGNILGILISALTIFASMLLVFVVLDTSPPLAKALHFDVVPYFEFRLDNIPDNELGFIERPFRHTEDHNWRGFGYDPAYGIEIPAGTRIWETDEEGFRNQPGVHAADVVVLGSSFPPYGLNLQDTYAKRLERNLNGYIVSNLAMGGYGPYEFQKVFRRFGLPKKPRYAIFAFQTGDIRGFLDQYVSGIEAPSVKFRKSAFGTFWSRWALAIHETEDTVNIALLGGFRGLLSAPTEHSDWIHPDVAVLKLPGNVSKNTVFLSHHMGQPADTTLNSPTWSLLEKVLREFKQTSEENRIVPIMAYIPFATEVYAKYSTPESGQNWLAVRDPQIATSSNDADAAQKLANRVGIPLINFLPAFEDAARDGKLVYYQLDSHWNSEGSEIAAHVTAQALQSRFGATPLISRRGESRLLNAGKPQYQDIIK